MFKIDKVYDKYEDNYDDVIKIYDSLVIYRKTKTGVKDITLDKQYEINNMLHPTKIKNFNTLFGNVSSLYNLLILLKKDIKYIEYVDVDIDDNSLNYIKSKENGNNKHYNKILTFCITDAILSNKELLTKLLSLNNLYIKFLIYTTLSKGIVKYTVVDKELFHFTKSLKYVLHILHKHKDKNIIKSGEYGKYIKRVKNTIFDKAIEDANKLPVTERQIFKEYNSQVTNDKLKELWLNIRY